MTDITYNDMCVMLINSEACDYDMESIIYIYSKSAKYTGILDVLMCLC